MRHDSIPLVCLVEMAYWKASLKFTSILLCSSPSHQKCENSSILGPHLSFVTCGLFFYHIRLVTAIIGHTRQETRSAQPGRIRNQHKYIFIDFVCTIVGYAFLELTVLVESGIRWQGGTVECILSFRFTNTQRCPFGPKDFSNCT